MRKMEVKTITNSASKSGEKMRLKAIGKEVVGIGIICTVELIFGKIKKMAILVSQI